MKYKVTWEIDVEADTPGQAARLARDYQLDPEAVVGVFYVARRASKYSTFEGTRVDLDALEGRYTNDEGV